MQSVALINAIVMYNRKSGRKLIVVRGSDATLIHTCSLTIYHVIDPL